ncbi:MAG: lysozyme [Candidatus Caldarchaeum sp.]
MRLEAYLCTGHKWTIGYGNTYYEDGTRVKRGDRITRERAEQLFRLVVSEYEQGVDRLTKDVPTSNAEFGALVSFAYNVGVGRLAKSTLLRLHRAGKKADAANQFLRWTKSGGKETPGLLRRRRAERALYLNNLEEFDKMIGYKP